MAPLAFDLTLHFVYGPEERLCLALEPAGIRWEAAPGRVSSSGQGPGGQLLTPQNLLICRMEILLEVTPS